MAPALGAVLTAAAETAIAAAAVTAATSGSYATGVVSLGGDGAREYLLGPHVQQLASPLVDRLLQGGWTSLGFELLTACAALQGQQQQQQQQQQGGAGGEGGGGAEPGWAEMGRGVWTSLLLMQGCRWCGSAAEMDQTVGGDGMVWEDSPGLGTGGSWIAAAAATAAASSGQGGGGGGIGAAVGGVVTAASAELVGLLCGFSDPSHALQFIATGEAAC